MKIEPTNTTKICIEFKVWCPRLNRVANRLFLLGSIAELGTWNINDALEGYPTPDIHIWKVEAYVPPMAQFEWVWVTSDLNRANVEWERTLKRNRAVDCFSGTLHTIWGDGEEVFLQSATCVELTTFMCLDDGYTMVLCGSTPTTGEWNLNKAVPAREFPKKSGYWKVQVAFDALANLEFKWAVVKEKDHGILRVQEKLPHTVCGRRAWMRVVAPWMSPIVVVVDTNMLCDVTDNMLSRTDLIVKERKIRGDEIRSWLVTTGRSGILSALESRKPSLRSVTSRTDTQSPSQTLSTQVAIPLPHTPSQPSSRATPAPPAAVALPAPPAAIALPAPPAAIALPAPPAAIALPAPPAAITLPAPPVRRTLDLEEHIKQRQESLSKVERVTRQLNKDLKEETQTIKGKGQARVPTDGLNIGKEAMIAEVSEDESCIFGNVLANISKLIWPTKTNETLKLKAKKGDCADRDKSNPNLATNPTKIEEESQGHTASASDEQHRPSTSLDDVAETGVSSTSLLDNRPHCTLSKSSPHCVASQTIVRTVLSDTGFTDLTWMSSVKADVTMSESVVTTSHTLTGAFAGDPNNTSDVDEGYSESDQLPTEKFDKLQIGAVSFWETQQKDLTPPWLNKTWTFPREDHSKFVSDTLSAWQDDYEHLDWLTSKVDMEDKYCTSKHGLAFNLPPDHPFIGSIYFVTEGTPRRSASESSLHKGLRGSKPSKSALEEKLLHFEKPSNSELRVDEVAPMIGSFGEICDPKLGKIEQYEEYQEEEMEEEQYIMEDQELLEKRRIARVLEEQWGAISSAQSEDFPDVAQFPCPGKNTVYSSTLESLIRHVGDFSFTRSERYKMSRYSWTDLSEAIILPTDPTDHRAEARERERLWGRSQCASPATSSASGSGAVGNFPSDTTPSDRPPNFRYYKPKV